MESQNRRKPELVTVKRLKKDRMLGELARTVVEYLNHTLL